MSKDEMADTLLAAAREFYGQGFKTDRKYWLHLAAAALRAKEQPNEG